MDTIPDIDPEAQVLIALKARHKKRVERRAKYLERLTPEERKHRDRHVAWIRRWRNEYKALAEMITRNKKFIRSQGHNNLKSLKMAMGLLQDQKYRAHTMLLGRMAYELVSVLGNPLELEEIDDPAQDALGGA